MNRVPKLRFPEFSGEWENNKNEIKIISGNSYPLEVYGNNGVLLIQGLNIYPGKLILDNPTYISSDYKITHQLVQKNDILMGLNRPIINNEIKVCLFNQELAYLYQRAGILRFDESLISKKFLYQHIRTPLFKKKMDSELVGSDQPYVKSDLFNKVDMFFPPLPEQEEIASFLTSVDSKIERLERKKELFLQYKKGMMQKIFSQELRFKDEFGGEYPEWEERSLGEVCDIRTGKKDMINKVENGKYPFFVRSKHIEKIDSYSFDGEAILIPGDGQIGQVYHYINGKFDYHQRVYKISDFILSKGKYIYYYLEEHFIRHALENTSKATVDSLRLPIIKEFAVMLPSLPEQTQIAEFLSSIDSKLELVDKELLGVKEFKKGLLQQMFV